MLTSLFFNHSKIDGFISTSIFLTPLYFLNIFSFVHNSIICMISTIVSTTAINILVILPPLLSLISSLFQLTFSQHFAHFCCIADKKLLLNDRIYLFPRQSSVPCILDMSSLFPRLLYVPFAIAAFFRFRFCFLIRFPFLPTTFVPPNS